MLLLEQGGLADLVGTPPKSIAIVSDAWHPQMNGVVRTLTTTCDILRQSGHRVEVISPDQYPSVPCPTYPEIRLALTMPGTVGRKLAKLQPDAVHIATEGPLGLSARRYCLAKAVPFTTFISGPSEYPQLTRTSSAITARSMPKRSRTKHRRRRSGLQNFGT